MMNKKSETMTLDLIHQAQQGDGTSLTRLVDGVRPKVYTYLLRLTLDHHLAEDLCQDTLLQMTRSLPKLKIDTIAGFWGWLYRTALNGVRQHHRQQQRRVRQLLGSRQHRAGLDVDAAVPLERVPSPAAADDAQRLLDLGVGVVPIDAEARHLDLGRPSPRAQIEAAARQAVEHGGLLGHPERMVVAERHAHHAMAHPDVLGASRNPRQEDLGRTHVGVPRQAVVLDRPDAVEPHLLGVHRLIDAFVQRPLFTRR